MEHPLQQLNKEIDILKAKNLELEKIIEKNNYSSYKKNEETIKLSLERQKLISSISASFVGEFNINVSINNLLKKIGEFSNADRSYVFMFRNDNKYMDNTHEWCAKGVNPEIDNLQNQACDIFPWWMSKLNNNEIVHIKNVSKLPKEASVERKTLETQGIKSIVEIPLNIFGKLIGFMGLDNMVSHKAWSTETIELLKISSEILANTIHSKRHVKLLKESKISLEKLNAKLLSTVKEEVKKNREKDRLMMIQSKQAAMGEMIGNIAHQWRQPLNDIGLYIQNLQDKYEYNDLNEKNLTEIVNRTMDKLEYMSQTIDDFRNFFRSDKKKEMFSLSESIKKTIQLTEASFTNNKIEIKLNLQENISFNGYPNEFSQALLNILNNAKDELTVANIQHPCVKISLSKSEKIITVKISNNGSEIPIKIIDSIFNPYFTTKPMQTGTGLGLYISKTIIEHNMAGKLYVHNTNNSAEFIINLYY